MTQDVGIAAPAAPGDEGSPELQFEEEIAAKQVNGVDRGRIVDTMRDHLDGASDEALKVFADHVQDPQEVLDFYGRMEDENKHQLTNLVTLRNRLLELEDGLQTKLADDKISYSLRERAEREFCRMLNKPERVKSIDVAARRRLADRVYKEKAEYLAKEHAKAKKELDRIDDIIADGEKELIDMMAVNSGAEAQMIAYRGSIDALNNERGDAYAGIKEFCAKGNYKDATELKDEAKRIENDVRLFARQERDLANTIHVNGRNFFSLQSKVLKWQEVRGYQQAVCDGLDLSEKDAQRKARGGTSFNANELADKIDLVRKLYEDQEREWKMEVAQMKELQKGSPAGAIFTPRSPMLQEMKGSSARFAQKRRLGINDLYASALSIAEEVKSQRPYI